MMHSRLNTFWGLWACRADRAPSKDAKGVEGRGGMARYFPLQPIRWSSLPLSTLECIYVENSLL